METGLNSLVILIITQAMIFLGELSNPITGLKEVKADNALRYVELLGILEVKTRGNLDQKEELFLHESLINLRELYKKKVGVL